MFPRWFLTAHPNRIPEKYRSFAHIVSTPELLESNFRWHIRLARTMKLVEIIKEHFETAESVLILLQDDPDPDAIASGLALRQVLGRNKQTAPLGTYGRVTRPENIAMVKLLEIEIEKITKNTVKNFDRIAVVDLQPPHLANPPKEIDLVVDHHPEQFNYHSHHQRHSTQLRRDVHDPFGISALHEQQHWHAVWGRRCFTESRATRLRSHAKSMNGMSSRSRTCIRWPTRT
jgi:hypothetical protein